METLRKYEIGQCLEDFIHPCIKHVWKDSSLQTSDPKLLPNFINEKDPSTRLKFYFQTDGSNGLKLVVPSRSICSTNPTSQVR